MNTQNSLCETQASSGFSRFTHGGHFLKRSLMEVVILLSLEKPYLHLYSRYTTPFLYKAAEQIHYGIEELLSHLKLQTRY